MQTTEASYWIRRLKLEPHPEGGHYRETYRSSETVRTEGLPSRYAGPRVFSTAIYFLLEADSFSAFHRLKSDEIWHFYAGSPAVVYILSADGACREIHLGHEPDCEFQAVIPAGSWFAARVRDENGFSLFGCTVAPGFDFADFELARRGDLIRMFPAHGETIRRLTREQGRSAE